MNKLKLGIIGILMILALLVAATGCNEAGDTSSTATDSSSEAVSSVAEESSEAPVTDAETILGTWETAWDMSDLFNTMISMSDETMGQFVHIDKLDFPLQITFSEDATYTVAADMEAFQKSMEENADDLLEGLSSYFAYMIEENELDMTVEEFLAASGIESMDEYLDMVMSGFEGTPAEFESTGKWSIEDGKLYMVDEGEELNEDEYFTYKLTENQLTLLEVFGADMDEDGMEELYGDLLTDLFPMSLTRVK